MQSEAELERKSADKLAAQTAPSALCRGRLPEEAWTFEVDDRTPIHKIGLFENVVDVVAHLEHVPFFDGDVLGERRLRPVQAWTVDGVPADCSGRKSGRIRKCVYVPHWIFQIVIEPVPDRPILYDQLVVRLGPGGCSHLLHPIDLPVGTSQLDDLPVRVPPAVGGQP